MRLCLVIATEPSVRNHMCETVKKMGLFCVKAEDGQYAYANRALMPDLFIVDLDEEAGIYDKVADTSLNLDRDSKAVIIGCLTEKDRKEVEQALKDGTDGFVLKPVNLEALASQYLTAGSVSQFPGTSQ